MMWLDRERGWLAVSTPFGLRKQNKYLFETLLTPPVNKYRLLTSLLYLRTNFISTSQWIIGVELMGFVGAFTGLQIGLQQNPKIGSNTDTGRAVIELQVEIKKCPVFDVPTPGSDQQIQCIRQPNLNQVSGEQVSLSSSFQTCTSNKIDYNTSIAVI